VRTFPTAHWWWPAPRPAYCLGGGRRIRVRSAISNRAMGTASPDEEATTVAGLVIHEACDSIPERGQKVLTSTVPLRVAPRAQPHHRDRLVPGWQSGRGREKKAEAGRETAF